MRRRKRIPVNQSLFEKWAQKVYLTSDCWLWEGMKDVDGYSILEFKAVTYKAARVAFELFRWPIKNGLEIDHLCQNRDCVNPNHLEAVTHKINVRRSHGLPDMENKNPHAVALGRRGGLKSCTFAKMSKKRLREISLMGVKARQAKALAASRRLKAALADSQVDEGAQGASTRRQMEK